MYFGNYFVKYIIYAFFAFYISTQNIFSNPSINSKFTSFHDLFISEIISLFLFFFYRSLPLFLFTPLGQQ